VNLDAYDPATLASQKLAALRAKAREIDTAWQLMPAQREQMLLRNEADIRAVHARLSALAMNDAGRSTSRFGPYRRASW
jgi:hypothetical protein